jgi:uncharacterized protein
LPAAPHSTRLAVMTSQPRIEPPPDADQRRAAKPVIVYALDKLPAYDAAFYENARAGMAKIGETIVPPREGRAFDVPAGHFFRIVSVEGPQVGDLNLWSAGNLAERFFSGKTRALNATHVTTGSRLWSALPYLRPMATVTYDTLAWYGFDADGAGVHDVIGTRCDPYTQRLTSGSDYHHCCHSNLTQALAERTRLPMSEAEPQIHDVLNVFMCTGYERASHRYFMKASPVRPGDFIEFFAEIDLIGALSRLPGRRLRVKPFERRRAVLSAESRDLSAERRSPSQLALAAGQRLFRPVVQQVAPIRSAAAIAPSPCGPRSPDRVAERRCAGRG